MWHVALADGLTLSHSFCGYQIHGENAKKNVNHHFSPVKYRKKTILQDPERLLCFLCSKLAKTWCVCFVDALPL
jgi:hypothetical protein